MSEALPSLLATRNDMRQSTLPLTELAYSLSAQTDPRSDEANYDWPIYEFPMTDSPISEVFSKST